MMSKVSKGSLWVAALAMLWFTAPDAQAQRRSSRSGSSGSSVYVGPGGAGYSSGGWGRSGTSWYVGPGGFGYSRGYNPGWGWDGYGYNRYGYGWGYPYRSGYWYSPGYYSDTYESDFYPSTTESYQSAYPPAQQSSNTALIHVRLPDANAEIFFNGSPTQQRGRERTFETPSLDSGFSHTYQIRARWTAPNGQTMDQTRTVNVQPGREAWVDFMQSGGGFQSGAIEERDREFGVTGVEQRRDFGVQGNVEQRRDFGVQGTVEQRRDTGVSGTVEQRSRISGQTEVNPNVRQPANVNQPNQNQRNLNQPANPTQPVNPSQPNANPSTNPGGTTNPSTSSPSSTTPPSSNTTPPARP